LRGSGEAVSHVYLSTLEEFLLGRYLMDSERIARRPNPAGLLSGEHGAAYRELLNPVRELDLRDDAALIRFSSQESSTVSTTATSRTCLATFAR
jgi:hypothetical protein